MSVRILDASSIRRALELRDLTEPGQGPHAIQLVVREIERSLAERWDIPVRRERAHPVVSLTENYDRLRIGPEAAARDSRYTRYLNEHAVLRTMTSVVVPRAIERLDPDDAVLSCPGLVYRRDAIDRLHVGEPHQLDVWRIRRNAPGLTTDDLEEMIGLVVESALPGSRWRVLPREHPYTTDGLQVDVLAGDAWVEVGECGFAHPEILTSCGLDAPPASGLASGWGLDRLVMIRKGMDDIRLLRSTDPRIAAQMLDLERYEPVSAMPAVRRDLSVAIDSSATPEEIGDRVREALGDEARAVEEVEVLSETAYDDLPGAARTRLGIAPIQKNVLVRVVLRHLERTLTTEEANVLRDRIYAALHEGSVDTWAATGAR